MNNYSLQRQTLIDDISSYQQIIKDSLQNHEPFVASKISEAESKNSNAVPTESPDVNEKFINEVEIKYQKEGKDSIASFYSQILDVATQCPYKGGVAVYRARPFVSMFNDTIEYDDDNNCALQGIYRVANNHNTIKNNSIKVIPNPATNKTDIILEGTYEGICSIIVTDALGKHQIEKRFNCTDKKYTLNVEHLSPGVYFIQVRVGDSDNVYAKIIIAR